MWMRTLAALGTIVAVSSALAAATLAQSHGHGPSPAAPAPPSHGQAPPNDAQKPAPTGAPARQPIRITLEELHNAGGVPPGWRFTIPRGDTGKGRDLFAKLECNKCHVVKGDFPERSREPGDVGPELTGMGGQHPVEYLAQSILDPNAVILLGPGHTGPDGMSIMPSFTDSLTVAEFVDLVAYLASLTDGDAGHHEAGGREQVVGDYRIRVAYQADGAHDHGAKASPPHGANHLMVFVTDARTGEPVPYLPLTVTIHADKTPARTVKLGPMVGDKGFHYGADLSLPARTTKLTVAIGPTTMRVMPSAAGRFAGTARATFDWPR